MITGTVQDGESVVVSSDLNSLESAMVCSVGGIGNEVVTSEFTISGNETAFIAGYGDLTWSDFKTGYCGFYYQDSSVIDAEKCTAITQDNMMCWAGTAANMLYYTGWGLVGTDTEDKVFSVFIDNFTLGKTYGGNAYHAIDWYFTGHYSPQTWSEWDIPLENSGGFYSETFETSNLSSYLTSTTFTVSGLTTAKKKLEAGYGVGVTFGYYDSNGTRTGGHLITLWGMTCDSSYSVTDPRYYTGIIVTDSDDNKSVSDPLSAPDTLKIISISYDSSLGAYLIDPDYAGANSRLEHLTFLAPNAYGVGVPDDAGPVNVYSGNILVKKGTVLTGETIVSGANNSMFVYNGGTANSTTVNTSGWMYVNSGGVANSTTVNSSGWMSIRSGGVANNTTINTRGVMFIYSGGVANSTTVNTSGWLNIHGGVANSTTVNSGGDIYIDSGGVANSTTVNSSGTMWVFSDGVANSSSGGVANDTVVNSAGSMYISNGGKHRLTLTMEGGAVVSAFEGGIVDFTVSERTTADGYLINNLALIQGTPTYTITVNADQAAGTYKLAQGASNFTQTVAIGTETVNYGSITANGADFVYNGVTYSLDQVAGNLTLTIAAAAPTGDQVQVYSSGTLVKQGTVLTGETIVGGANNSMFVYNGGTANSTTVNSSGWMYVYSGGVANSTTVNTSGIMYVSSGGVANSTTVNTSGRLRVSSGGVANSTTVNSSGWLDIYSGGVANSTTVNTSGRMYVSPGGVANSTTVSGSSGCLTVLSNGVANDTVVNDCGSMSVLRESVANDTAVNSRSFMYVYSSGMANRTTVNNRGRLNVYSSGVANDTVVNSGGFLYIHSGAGAANDTIVSSGGSMSVVSGGKHCVTLTMEAGAVVSAYEGGIIDFTVSEWNTTAGYLINDLSLIQGTPAYTITVNADQAQGVYKLAQGADGFKGTLTIGNGTIDYGTITVNGADLVYGNVAYSLDLYKGDLTLNIGNVAPAGDQVKVFSSGTLVKQGKVLTGEMIFSGANDSMHVSSGGVAESTKVSSGFIAVSSGGVANNTLIDSHGRMYVQSGGAISNTLIAGDSGVLLLLSGAAADNTSMTALGNFTVEGTANHVTLDNQGRMFVYSGGEANNVTGNGMVTIRVWDSGTVNSVTLTGSRTDSGLQRPVLIVSSGGVANKVKGYDWSTVYVSGGGFASDVSVSGRGCLRVQGEEYTPEGEEMAEALYGSAKNVTVYSGGSAVIIGGEVTGLMVSSGGYASVAGVPDVSAVDVYGKLYGAEIKYGGSAVIIGGVELWEDTVLGGTVTVNSWANIYGELIFDLSERSAGDTYIVDNIANLNLTEIGCYSVTVSDNQANGTYKLAGNAASFNETISIDGTALSVNGTGVTINGKQYTLAVTDSILTLTIGTAPAGDQVQVYSSGTLVKQGSVLTGETIVGGANNTMYVYSGGTANSTTVNASGHMYVSSGGTANSTTVNSNGIMYVRSGGVTNETVLNSGGWMYVSSGGTANSTTVNSSGHMMVNSGGVANDTVVSGDMRLYGGVANDTVINNSGGLYVGSSGVANDTVINSGGDMIVSIDGVANSTTVSGNSSFLVVFDNGVVNDTVVNSGGWLGISSGNGVANDTIVNSNGDMRLYDGMANDTVVNGGGRMYVSIDGVANDTVVNSGGSMRISSGGKHRVTLTMEAGAVVSAYAGGIIDFTVSERTVGDGYLINDLSLIQGTPAYTITVNADQAAGTYKLAQGASNFTQTVAIGTETVNYGSITANGADFVYNGVTYSLDQVAGNLTLTIGAAVPAGDQVQVYSSGTLVKQGTVLTGETIIAGLNDSMYVSSGGTANSTTVNSGGNLYVYDRGTANSTTVNSWGDLYVSSGGTANSTTVNYVGALYIYNGGVANSTTLKYGGYLTVSSGGTANSTTVNKSGNLRVSSGGTANNATVNSWGILWVSSGGTANSTTVNSGGFLYVSSGGTANSTTVNSGGYLYVSSGGDGELYHGKQRRFDAYFQRR